MPGLASETIGIWVAAGSRDESTETAGSTHFLEHMLFKGTATKDAKTIAAAFDRTGETPTPSRPRNSPATTPGASSQT